MCQALITHFNHPSYYNRYYRIKGKITTKPVLQKIGTKVKFFVMFAPVHAQYTLEAKTVTRKDRMIDSHSSFPNQRHESNPGPHDWPPNVLPIKPVILKCAKNYNSYANKSSNDDRTRTPVE